MIPIQKIKDNPALVVERLAIKNFDASAIVDLIVKLDEKRRSLQKQLDDTKASSNAKAKEIGMLFKQGKGAEANALKAETATLKEVGKALEVDLTETVEQLNSELVKLPNIPHDSVPAGKSEDDNEVIYEEGELPTLYADAVPHWELTEKYQIIDFELGAKVTGAGFPFYRGKGARLQRGLINFFLDEARSAGYEEYQTPLLVNEDSAYGTGQLPDKEGQMYEATVDKLYLIPTAEVPVTNIFRNVMLKNEELPLKATAYSNCFRREAGSYGAHVRGLNRLHQFDKVEIVQVVAPEHSYETLDQMREHVANLLRKLELPFRVLRLCGGDVSFTAAITYDFEVWSAAQKRWLEVSSVSNFEDFQANRLKCRYKNEDGKSQLVHTLNGSALALPRIVAALLENNQTAEGIKMPEALVSYLGFDMI